MSDRQRFYSDVCFDVWRGGGNPDRVDPDKCDTAWANGADPERYAEYVLRRGRIYRNEFDEVEDVE